MKLTQVASNVTTVETDGKTVVFSYNTPVAVVVGGSMYRTATKYSRTTTKHVNQYMEANKLATRTYTVDQVEFDRMLAK